MRQAASIGAARGALPSTLKKALMDAAWGFFLAGLLVLVLLFIGSEDRGFIYVDF